MYIDEVQLTLPVDPRTGEPQRPVTIEASRALGSMDKLDELVPQLDAAVQEFIQRAKEEAEVEEVDEFGNAWRNEYWVAAQPGAGADDRPQAGVDYWPGDPGEQQPLPRGWFEDYDSEAGACRAPLSESVPRRWWDPLAGPLTRPAHHACTHPLVR